MQILGRTPTRCSSGSCDGVTMAFMPDIYPLIILNERHLQRALDRYVEYYNSSRTHLSLGKDAPDGRGVERPSEGRIVAVPQVGGLHHRYARAG